MDFYILNDWHLSDILENNKDRTVYIYLNHLIMIVFFNSKSEWLVLFKLIDQILYFKKTFYIRPNI